MSPKKAEAHRSLGSLPQDVTNEETPSHYCNQQEQTHAEAPQERHVVLIELSEEANPLKPSLVCIDGFTSREAELFQHDMFSPFVSYGRGRAPRALICANEYQITRCDRSRDGVNRAWRIVQVHPYLELPAPHLQALHFPLHLRTCSSATCLAQDILDLVFCVVLDDQEDARPSESMRKRKTRPLLGRTEASLFQELYSQIVAYTQSDKASQAFQLIVTDLLTAALKIPGAFTVPSCITNGTLFGEILLTHDATCCELLVEQRLKLAGLRPGSEADLKASFTEFIDCSSIRVVGFGLRLEEFLVRVLPDILVSAQPDAALVRTVNVLLNF